MDRPDAKASRRAGGLVTDVIAFHVYETAANFCHLLRTTRADFAAAGRGGRPIRISEWRVGEPGDLAAAIRPASVRSEEADFDGVAFWWDRQITMDPGACRAAQQPRTRTWPAA